MKLFEKYLLNNKITLRNRFVMAPMTNRSDNDEGVLSDQQIEYYKYRSTGVGMVITATTYLEPTGKGFIRQFYGGDDSKLETLKKLADAIHEGDAKAILQIFHAGRKAKPCDMPDGVSVSASAIPGKREIDNIPRAMTNKEILYTIKTFKDATIRAYKAGFDGIEIHGANTYLIHQYFSPHSNRRTDKWGGSLENRVKFPLAIIEACFDAYSEIGDPKFIIGYRFSPEENSEPGITLDDTDYLINRLCETPLDYLHISLAHYEQTSIRDINITDIPLSRAVKTIAKRKPIIGVGSVLTREDGQKVLDYGADMIAVGKQLLIDGKSIEKWEKNIKAYESYDPALQKEEKMTDFLHQSIVDRADLIPVKK
jgi:2,4-dienoyl-CoA reductase-like NADH-dependent reductase (Old Yellow Enzyme family)